MEFNFEKMARKIADIGIEYIVEILGMPIDTLQKYTELGTPAEIEALKAKLQKVERERNAAIADIKSLLFHMNALECSFCDYNMLNGDCKNECLCVSPKDGGVPSGWKWHGLESTTCD